MSLKSALQLEIPDIINNHGGPVTLSELTEVLSINKAKSDCISRLMHILIHSGFFVKLKIPKAQEDDEEEDGYSLTSASRLLLSFFITPVSNKYIVDWDCCRLERQ